LNIIAVNSESPNQAARANPSCFQRIVVGAEYGTGDDTNRMKTCADDVKQGSTDRRLFIDRPYRHRLGAGLTKPAMRCVDFGGGLLSCRPV